MAQIQHYVPQSVLRRFCGDDGQLWVYDKWNRRVFRTGPRNVAAEGAFYDLEAPDGSTYSLETPLGQLESAANTCIERLLARGETGFLTNSDKWLLSEFAAVQFIRIRGFRERFKDMSAQLVDKLRRWAPPGTPDDLMPQPADDHAAKLTSLRMILDSSPEFAARFYGKDWLLFVAPDNLGYWISDNPITLHNSVPPPTPLMGNLGLAFPGIEIYLPLSPQVTLSFLCPTMAEKIVESNDTAVHLVHTVGANVPSAEVIGYLADAVRFGFPVPSMATNVDFANSLQAANAERFIFSSSGDFDLVEKMLSDNPDLAGGPRMQVG